MPTRWVPVLAFLYRAFVVRPLRGSPEWGEKVDARAKRYVALLENLPPGLRRSVVIENLRRESDLLDCEAALLPGPLELQVLALRSDDPELTAIARSALLEKQPLWKLFRAAVQQAIHAGVETIRVDLGANETAFAVLHKRGAEWREEMTIPRTLEPSFRGVLKVVERVADPLGFHVRESSRFVVDPTWLSNDVCELRVRALADDMAARL